MSNESNVTGAAGGLGSARVLPNVIERIRENTFLASLIYWADATGKGSPTVKIPRLTATPTMTDITPGSAEADAQANTELTSDSLDLTAAPMAVHFVISKWLDDSAVINWMEISANEAIATMADDVEVSIATAFSGFSTSSGSTGQDFTVAAMDAGIVEYGANSKKKGEGKAVIVLHRQGVGQLRTDMTSGSGAALCTPFTNTELISIFGQNPGQSVIGSAVGMFYGIPMFQTGNVQKINANVDYCGAIFARSPNMSDVNAALGGVWKWMPEVTQYDQRSQNKLSKSTSGIQALGIGEIGDLLGHRLVHLV
jgi:hypothetical protein